MTQYLIYFQDNQKNDLIDIRDTYRNKQDAICHLEKVALDNVKKAEGEKQVDICKQDKSLEQITNDATLRNGLYIVKYLDTIILCEKSTKILQGSIWNSYNTVSAKIGVFGIIEYKFEDNILRCACSMNKKELKPTRDANIIVPNFLNELTKMINDTDGKFKLRTIRTDK